MPSSTTRKWGQKIEEIFEFKTNLRHLDFRWVRYSLKVSFLFNRDTNMYYCDPDNNYFHYSFVNESQKDRSEFKIFFKCETTIATTGFLKPDTKLNWMSESAIASASASDGVRLSASARRGSALFHLSNTKRERPPLELRLVRRQQTQSEPKIHVWIDHQLIILMENLVDPRKVNHAINFSNFFQRGDGRFRPVISFESDLLQPLGDKLASQRFERADVRHGHDGHGHGRKLRISFVFP